MKNFKEKLEFRLKHDKKAQLGFNVVFSNVIRFLGLFIKTNKKLVLITSLGKKYNDSPRAIFEYMINQSKYEDLEFVWALDDPRKYYIPKAKLIKIDTLRYFIIALQAKYWITSVNIERGLNFKKKSTKYLNTWHGVPVKHIGNDVMDRSDFNFKNVNLLCCSGEYEVEIYSKCFRAKREQMILSGLPRNDVLYTTQTLSINDMKRMLNIPSDKKIILYAPTWRDSNDNGTTFSIKPPINLLKWKRALSEEYIVLFRAHSITHQINGLEFDDFFQDFTSHDCINDLLVISDILITDYSATVFDFSILERPILCFGYDYEEYKVKRGFYFDLENEFPNGVIRDEDELIEKIKNMNYQDECKKTKVFSNKFLTTYGNATEVLVKAFFCEYY